MNNETLKDLEEKARAAEEEMEKTTKAIVGEFLKVILPLVVLRSDYKGNFFKVDISFSNGGRYELLLNHLGGPKVLRETIYTENKADRGEGKYER